MARMSNDEIARELSGINNGNRTRVLPASYINEAKRVSQGKGRREEFAPGINRKKLHDLKRQNFIAAVEDNLFTPSVANR